MISRKKFLNAFVLKRKMSNKVGKSRTTDEDTLLCMNKGRLKAIIKASNLNSKIHNKRHLVFPNIVQTLPGSISLLVEERRNYQLDHCTPMNSING